MKCSCGVTELGTKAHYFLPWIFPHFAPSQLKVEFEIVNALPASSSSMTKHCYAEPPDGAGVGDAQRRIPDARRADIPPASLTGLDGAHGRLVSEDE